MKIIALDVGEKRIGVAVSDTSLNVVFPREAIFDNHASEIHKLIKAENADVLLVGLPLNSDGSESLQAVKVRKFIDTLGKTPAKIEYISEYGSTLEAQQRFRSLGFDRKIKKGVIDSTAAALLLETYLARL
jgi:putative Holliday junction resolvase